MVVEIVDSGDLPLNSCSDCRHYRLRDHPEAGYCKRIGTGTPVVRGTLTILRPELFGCMLWEAKSEG